MKEKMNPKLLFSIIFTVISIMILTSCRSSFLTAGTTIECDGKFLQPVTNPTERACFSKDSLAIFNYLKANFKRPQEIAGKKFIGKVRVVFIISKEGEVCDVRVISKPRKYIDDEFVRILKIMPKWKPAKNEGKVVDSFYLLDIKLHNE